MVEVTKSGPQLSGVENRQLLRSSALSLFGALITATVGVGLVLVLARNVTPDVLGWFAIGQSWFLISVAVVGLGTKTGLVYAVSHVKARGEVAAIGRLMRFALIPVLALWLVVLVAYWALSGWLVEVLNVGGPGAETAWRVMAVLVGAAVLSDAVNAVALGLGAIKPIVILDRIMRPIVQLGFVLWAASAGFYSWLNDAWALAYVPILGLGIIWLARLWPHPGGAGGATTSSESPPTAGWFWRYTGPRAGTTIVQVMLQRVDIVLVGILAGPLPAAVYTAATRFLVVAQVGNQALSVVLQPRLSEAMTLGEGPRAKALYQRSSSWLVLTTWPVLLVSVVFAPQIMALFGAEYTTGTSIIYVLAGAMLFATMAGLNDVALLMSGRSGLGLINHLVALLAMVLVDLALVPSIGAFGAAIGWALSIVIKNVLAVVQVRREQRILPWSRESAAASGLALLAFAAVPYLATQAIGVGMIAVVAALLVGSAVYLVGLYVWRNLFGFADFQRGRGQA